MNIATILFTYNRSKHTKAVLDALKVNDVYPQKLIIFQDGKKKSTQEEEWNKVKEIIESIDWCETEIYIAEKNKGLAQSIIDGLNYTFLNYDAAIVLEDDCVPHPKFMSYMVESLEKYKEIKKVYNINGCAWPISLEKGNEDAYFSGRISSWGWGTWKDRWNEYEVDYTLLSKIKKDPKMEQRLKIWGPDLESYLTGNVTGKCDSWAVFWALKVIEKNGYCLTTYESLVNNIGFDGTGVHCGTGKNNVVGRSLENLQKYSLPNNIEINEESADKFQKAFTRFTAAEKLKCYNTILQNWVSAQQEGKKAVDIIIKKGINNVAIWGKGKLCDLLLKDLGKKVKVEYIIESNPCDIEYKGIPIVSIESLSNNVQAIIVIPIYDINKIMEQINGIRNDIDIIGIDELVK